MDAMMETLPSLFVVTISFCSFCGRSELWWNSLAGIDTIMEFLHLQIMFCVFIPFQCLLISTIYSHTPWVANVSTSKYDLSVCFSFLGNQNFYLVKMSSTTWNQDISILTSAHTIFMFSLRRISYCSLLFFKSLSFFECSPQKTYHCVFLIFIVLC